MADGEVETAMLWATVLSSLLGEGAMSLAGVGAAICAQIVAWTCYDGMVGGYVASESKIHQEKFCMMALISQPCAQPCTYTCSADPTAFQPPEILTELDLLQALGLPVLQSQHVYKEGTAQSR